MTHETGCPATPGELVCDVSGLPGLGPSVHRVHTDEPVRRPRIIGIAGWKGSGKDTAARAICRPFSGMYKISLADAVREVACMVYGFTQRDLLDPVRKEQVDEGLIDIGQGMRKACGNDIWVKAIQVRIGRIKHRRRQLAFAVPLVLSLLAMFVMFATLAGKSAFLFSLVALVAGVLLHFFWIRQPAGFVVPDIRFADPELDWVRSEGGEVWVVYRPGKTWDGTEIEALPCNQERFDRVLHNTGGAAALARGARRAWAAARCGDRNPQHREVDCT